MLVTSHFRLSDVLVYYKVILAITLDDSIADSKLGAEIYKAFDLVVTCTGPNLHFILYFAQELLSTFGTDIGEVALQPSTGGTFIVELFTDANASKNATSQKEGEAEENVDELKEVEVLKHTLWDRKSEGGFPETKELKKRLRNIIDPSRDLGHVDGKKFPAKTTATASASNSAPNNKLQSSAQKDSAPTAIKASTSTPVNTISQPSASSPVSAPQLNEAKPEEVKEKKQEEEKVILNERGKIVITGLEGEGGFGVCRPGDEECGEF
ncbi:hypothetical protein BOTNAR_0140g00200 [Botryotinia narcissicola]|uniref:Uncharacterized protein n=1 Tax=Botryotinia narcissicola TaxID=278944 RepID=A0A4Z1IH36_9HELO|nr:hypothetical protein BOTNAR_0140g00200 [Botryotinia narcissicola]